MRAKGGLEMAVHELRFEVPQWRVRVAIAAVRCAALLYDAGLHRFATAIALAACGLVQRGYRVR